MNTLVQYSPAAQPVEKINARSGARTQRLMTLAEYRKMLKDDGTELSNREIKEEFFAYLRTHSSGNTANLAAMLTSGNVGVTGVTQNKDGTKAKIDIVFLDKLVQEPKLDVEALSVEQQKELLTKLMGILGQE